MKSSHSPAAVSTAFDEPNLIADAGLVPLVRSAERCGLPELVTRSVRISGAVNSAGAHPAAKVMSLVAARLIVRRVRRLNSEAAGQGELSTTRCYHLVFTDSPFAMLQAEPHHRRHAFTSLFEAARAPAHRPP